ncbi:uncharacterized protein EI90DRAFT_3033910 [Cantharellus anzutake]|uniref:uncharacterized protein n=1 Tax=Cantharellus anzutake TaxID=1750568 RepID=UPI001905A592|nr:uncharacterized protein EI90DRAFT_3033910 [Cantharellus anzutake]KAF8341414.1 hypothetical protein EI90DRAFT_3033910 [Cantharellus anzutake]
MTTVLRTDQRNMYATASLHLPVFVAHRSVRYAVSLFLVIATRVPIACGVHLSLFSLWRWMCMFLTMYSPSRCAVSLVTGATIPAAAEFYLFCRTKLPGQWPYFPSK